MLRRVELAVVAGAIAVVATHQDGDAIILTFESRSGAAVDLVSRPEANAVESRDC